MRWWRSLRTGGSEKTEKKCQCSFNSAHVGEIDAQLLLELDDTISIVWTMDYRCVKYRPGRREWRSLRTGGSEKTEKKCQFML
jgi:hypothetical protein